jgi:hypothetical protein
MEIYAQKVSACFNVEKLGVDVTVENLPFDWQPSRGERDIVGANEAARWLWENAPECYGKAMSLIWVNCSPA